MKRPNIEKLGIAIEWLRSYESAGDGPDTAFSACNEVANWLDEKLRKAEFESRAVEAVLVEAKRAGSPVSRKAARTFVRRRSAGQGDPKDE